MLRILISFNCLSFFLLLAACGPGERFICRTAADYNPPAGETRAGLPALGSISVENPEIACLLPEGFDKNKTGELVAALLTKDLLSSGRFNGGAGDIGSSDEVKVHPSLESLTVIAKDGVSRLAEVSVKIKLYKNGDLLMEKTYSRDWDAGEAPDYEKAWEETLPSAMLEIRQDIISALSRSF